MATMMMTKRRSVVGLGEPRLPQGRARWAAADARGCRRRDLRPLRPASWRRGAARRRALVPLRAGVLKGC
eukprot:1737012-Rhodomonas_salina.1